jgi:hypothetical protein
MKYSVWFIAVQEEDEMAAGKDKNNDRRTI